MGMAYAGVPLPSIGGESSGPACVVVQCRLVSSHDFVMAERGAALTEQEPNHSLSRLACPLGGMTDFYVGAGLRALAYEVLGRPAGREEQMSAMWLRCGSDSMAELNLPRVSPVAVACTSVALSVQMPAQSILQKHAGSKRAKVSVSFSPYVDERVHG